MQRRGFLKFALGGTVGLVASPAIWTTLYDLAYWTQNWGWIPRLEKGENHFIPTVSKLDGTPITVRLVDDRVIRPLGNKENTYSNGGLTPLAASEAQLMYSESRIKRPLLKGPDGGYSFISWEKAENILKEKTTQANGSLAFLNADSSSSLNDIFSAFLAKNGSEQYYLMPSEEQTAINAWLAMGGNGRIGYDLKNSDFILSVGANFMDSWGTVAHNRAIFNETHPIEEEASLKIAYTGAMQDSTQVVSDMWLPIKPGTEEIFLHGILSELVRRGKTADVTLLGFGSQYTLDDVAKSCGTDTQKLKKLVDELLNASRPLVLTGATLGQANSTTSVMLTIAINYALGRINQDGSMVNLPMHEPLLPEAQNLAEIFKRNFVAFCQNVANNKDEAPKVLFINEANPIYALSKDTQVEQAFKNIEYKVTFATHWSETCAVSDLVLPAACGLERFDDVYTPYGSGAINWTIAKPITNPQFEARPVGELFIALAEELGVNLGINDVPSLLEKRANSLGVNFKQQLESGDTFEKSHDAMTIPMISFMPLLHKRATPPQTDIALLTYINSAAGNPSVGIPPYANRAITAYQLQDGLAIAQMNKVTADKLGLNNQDKAFIETRNGKMPVQIKVFEGIMNDVVAVMAGLGHTEFDRFSTNKGNNILQFTEIDMEAGSDLPVWTHACNVVKG